jgi:hypothetical protein
VTLVAVGLCTVQATQAGDTNWAAATPMNQSFNITQEAQTITFGNLANRLFGSGTFTVSATATSLMPVSFNSQTGATCTVSGSTVTLVAAGLCTVQATQAGDTNWAAAPPVNQSFTIGQETQSITFNGLSDQLVGAAPFAVNATASSSLTVSFNSQTPAVCGVSGNTVTLIAAGTCTVQATQAGNTNYSAATAVNESFLVTQGTQTITFAAIANQALGTSAFALSATATSGLSVSFASQTMPVCTVANGSVTLVAIGTCTIQATQSGNTSYSAAPPVSQSFTVMGGIGTAGVNTLNFPNTLVGGSSPTQTFNFQNSGNTALTIAAIAPAGPDAADYRYSSDGAHPCPLSPLALGAGASCTLDITFAPVSQGQHNNAQIAITDNSGNISGSTQSIGVAGVGIVLLSIATSANNASLAYGESEQFTATGTYSDNSTANLTSQTTWASSVPGVATVNTSGVATAQSVGQTNITAALSGITSNALQLSVTPGAPASIAASAGSGQSVVAGSAFASTLQAVVKDGGGNPVPNAPVVFTAPAGGASGTFANGMTVYTATTNGSGAAVSTVFTANSIAGNYSVSAGVSGVSNQAGFSLTNIKVPTLTISETPAGLFIQGQPAAFVITVANAADGAPTAGTVTVAQSVPAGLTLTGLSGGATWNCSLATASCTSSTALNAGATSNIAVAVAVALNAPAAVSNGVMVSGGGSQPSAATYSTPIVSACAVTQDTIVSVTDLQQVINEALGVAPPSNDLNSDGRIDIVDLQIVTTAALGGSCNAS